MHDALDPEPTAWIALNIAQHTWPTLAKSLARHLAMPAFRQQLQTEGIRAVETAIPGAAEKLATVQQSRAFASALSHIQTTQVTVLTLVDADYPPALRWIPEPPPVLYVRGLLEPAHRLAVAVVGSRQPSNYGKAMAQRLSADLARNGYTVISGLARGIDSLAHQGALGAGGQTLAVLGSGINVVYPPENRRLLESICERGAAISEFPFDTKPDRWNFPRRNRIISGLALGTLVIEATANSGSLHTARHALDQGREVFAVPGRIDTPNSRGTNSLIKSGAKLVESVHDVIEEFPDAVRASAHHHRAPVDEAVEPPPDLSVQEAQILALVQPEDTHIDAVIQTSQLPAHVVASILTTLELRGFVRQSPGKFFARNVDRAAKTLDKRK